MSVGGPPEEPKGACNAKGCRWIVVRQCSVERGPQVLVVLDDPSLPDSIVRVLQAGFGCLRKAHEIFAMVRLRLLELAFVTQSGASVHAKGLQHPVSRSPGCIR